MKFGTGIFSAIVAIAAIAAQGGAPERKVIASNDALPGAVQLQPSKESPWQPPVGVIEINAVMIDLAQEWPSDVIAHNNKQPSQSDLAVALHRELKRVGCYTGAVEAEWSAPSRAAMTAFNARVNATLPVARPDFILLTLVRGHAERACGAPCASGEVLTPQNRCLPAAVVAHAPRATAIALQDLRPAPHRSTITKMPALAARAGTSGESNPRATTRTATAKPAIARRIAGVAKAPAATANSKLPKIVTDITKPDSNRGAAKRHQRVASQPRATTDAKARSERSNKS